MKSTSAASKSGPDAKELSGRDLPKAAFPGKGARGFRVFLDKAVHEQIAKHAGEDVGVEICGVLVGVWQSDDDGPFVSITASIPGESVSNKLSEVTFTHETWAKIHKRMDADFADRSIIGWYHTHPNFGIFLSERDCFIHEHFFREPGQVAYVVDPIRKEEGFFIWSNGKPIPASHYWVGSDIRIAPPIEGDKREGRERSRNNAPATPGTSAESDRKSRREKEPEAPPPLGWLSNMLFGVCLFLLGFMLAQYLANSDRDKYRDTILTKFAVMKGVKPGLGPSLASINQNLSSLSFNSGTISQISSLPPDQKIAWSNLSARLSELTTQVEVLRTLYALNPEDEEAVAKLGVGWLAAYVKEQIAAMQANKPAATQPATQAATQPATTTTAPTVQPK